MQLCCFEFYKFVSRLRLAAVTKVIEKKKFPGLKFGGGRTTFRASKLTSKDKRVGACIFI
jgi:hypothetical protein